MLRKTLMSGAEMLSKLKLVWTERRVNGKSLPDARFLIFYFPCFCPNTYGRLPYAAFLFFSPSYTRTKVTISATLRIGEALKPLS